MTGPLEGTGDTGDVHIVVAAPNLDGALGISGAELSAQVGPTHHLVTFHGGVARWPDDRVETLIRAAYVGSFP